MLVWKDAKKSKPARDERVLLKVAHRRFPLVGCWNSDIWEACTANLRCITDSWAHGGEVVESFSTDDVTHYAEIGKLPT
jgi:hypothetical protein